MTIINDIKIKDYYVHKLLEHKGLLSYVRENRKTGNMAEITLWKQVHKKIMKKGIMVPILLPRPSGTPSKIEGELSRPGTSVP